MSSIAAQRKRTIDLGQIHPIVCNRSWFGLYRNSQSGEDSLTLNADNFYAALQAAGLAAVPREFAVVPQHQIIPSNTMAEICEFIRVFDEVTAGAARIQ